MRQYRSLYQFNEEGIKVFEDTFSEVTPDLSLEELSPDYVEPIA